jgi:hypothetical protein
MTNAQLQAKLKTFPDAAMVCMEDRFIEEADIGLDDDGDVYIFPCGDYVDQEDDDEEDDEEEDEDEDDE